MKPNIFLIIILFFLPSLLHSDMELHVESAAQKQIFEEFFISSDEAQLFCRKIGSGKPLVVLHGGPGMTQDYLLPQMCQLAEKNMVIFYDQRGCGQSYCPLSEKTINLESYLKDLEQIRQWLGAEKISILGHSWGGFLAMNYAMTYPKQVEKLILSNSMPASSEDLSLFIAEWLHRMGPYMNELDEIHQTSGYKEGDTELVEKLHRLMFRTYCYDPNKVDLLNLRLTPIAALHGARVYALLQSGIFLKPFNFFYDLYALNVPTLIIHGDADPIPHQTASTIHNHITGSIFMLMKNCGHFPFVEDPDPYFSQIQEFLHGDSIPDSI